jgi:hypothetical protein
MEFLPQRVGRSSDVRGQFRLVRRIEALGDGEDVLEISCVLCRVEREEICLPGCQRVAVQGG